MICDDRVSVRVRVRRGRGKKREEGL